MYRDVAEQFFIALKHRRRPIRILKVINNSRIGEGNLFNFIGFANTGCITEQLTLNCSGIYPYTRPEATVRPGLLTKYLPKKKFNRFDPKSSQTI